MVLLLLLPSHPVMDRQRQEMTVMGMTFFCGKNYVEKKEYQVLLDIEENFFMFFDSFFLCKGGWGFLAQPLFLPFLCFFYI